MTAIVIPPDLWEGDDNGVITTWLFDEGDRVEAGDVVAEVMIEKAQYEITAPQSGTLIIRTAVEGEVSLGCEIGQIV